MKEKIAALLLPPASVVIFVMLFLYLSLTYGSQLLFDGDTGHQIRVGEIILDSRAIPEADVFSHRTPPMPWMVHGWLSNVIMALVHRYSGLTGIVIFFAGLIAAVYTLLFRAISRENNILVALVVTVLVIATSRLHWLARPHIFSHLLIIIWYSILDAHQAGRRKSLLVLAPIMALWVNLHGGFIVGFILLGVYVAGNLLESCLVEGDEKVRARKPAREMIPAIALCLLAALVNPAGHRVLLLPFSVVSDTYIMDRVREYLSPNFHATFILPYKYHLLLLITLFGVLRRRLHMIELLLVMLFTGMSLESARHIPLFAFITAPILTRHASHVLSAAPGRWVDFIRRKSEEMRMVNADAKGYAWMAVAVSAILAWHASGNLTHGFDPKVMPVEAVDFLKREPIPGNMFCDDEFGDYLIYAAWPQYKVFYDGRLDMYGADRMKEYYKIIQFEPGWEEAIDTHHIGWVMSDAGSPLSSYLEQDRTWRSIYSDSLARIFVKDRPEYRHLADRYTPKQLDRPPSN